MFSRRTAVSAGGISGPPSHVREKLFPDLLDNPRCTHRRQLDNLRRLIDQRRIRIIERQITRPRHQRVSHVLDDRHIEVDTRPLHEFRIVGVEDAVVLPVGILLRLFDGVRANAVHLAPVQYRARRYRSCMRSAAGSSGALCGAGVSAARPAAMPMCASDAGSTTCQAFSRCNRLLSCKLVVSRLPQTPLFRTQTSEDKAVSASKSESCCTESDSQNTRCLAMVWCRQFYIE